MDMRLVKKKAKQSNAHMSAVRFTGDQYVKQKRLKLVCLFFLVPTKFYTKMSVKFQTSSVNWLSLPNFKLWTKKKPVSIHRAYLAEINLIKTFDQIEKSQIRIKCISIAPVARTIGIWDYLLCFMFPYQLTCVYHFWFVFYSVLC